MGAPLDLTGYRFGYVTVVSETEPHFTPGGSKLRCWVCKCDCGNTFITTTQNLRSGDTKSCGCYSIESRRKNATKHGDSCSRLHKIWKAMRKRCTNKNGIDYKYYGGKGVKVCDEWNDYTIFREWALANGYNDELTIDRVDANGDYCPNNCRWISIKEQANNRTNNKIFDLDGESHTIAEWSEIKGIKYSTLYARLRRGLTIENALA